MSVTDLWVPTARNALAALSNCLGKAEKHAAERGEQADDLAALRLAPDMYPLGGQLRFVAFQAQEAVHRLRGEDVPAALLEVRREGWEANERPGSLAAGRARLADAASFLASVEPEALRPGADRELVLELPNGIVLDMTGAAFVRDWALPQLYFHLTAAYAIMRSHGVPLGKADFVPHMFAYVRPGTMPSPEKQSD